MVFKLLVLLSPRIHNKKVYNIHIFTIIDVKEIKKKERRNETRKKSIIILINKK
jgi:hypothetical protein